MKGIKFISTVLEVMLALLSAPILALWLWSSEPTNFQDVKWIYVFLLIILAVVPIYIHSRWGNRK